MAESLSDILAKPIDRQIDGVIKADDQSSLVTELEEYVLTDEIKGQLDRFLHAYNNYDTANGVWISGFFGSGKSHLLKMLATLLENRDIDGVTAWSIFEGKLQDDPMIRGALDKAVKTPSRSILFNIDQKAAVIDKGQVDALVGVFQRVFDEMCGYFGQQPHIARFERDLDSRGHLAEFIESFERKSGKPWVRGREQALFESASIAEAFAEVTNSDPAADAKNILSKYRDDMRISIEDFAMMVKAWIDTQEKGYRLNFFVDEVGQYIADNVKLMTNLQTIAETLNTKCRGQAWIIVTAQQGINDVVGDMTARQENDFSKIQARFSCRMPLNSHDVAEVIQQRLLEKTAAGAISLGSLYDREENNLGTLFNFTDGSYSFKGFRDREHFIGSYPFPPYQYDLFQMALSGLSTHNAFEGKHSSVGERSMLGVFQDVGRKLADARVGTFTSFDLMFEGIRSALKSSAQQSIRMAERNHSEEPTALRVLKALFLVKYVKEFKATPRNIAILLMTDPESDRSGERREIEAALAFLERQTLVQRNGDAYEFLTNEEKDVENEIKALDVDHSEREKLLEELVFTDILRKPKILHHASGTEYPFTRRLDRRSLGREQELGIDILTPLSGEDASSETVRMRTLASEDMAVVLPDDVELIRDLTLYEQTRKFLRQASTDSQQASRGRIIAEKTDQNTRRRTDLQRRLEKLFGEADIYVRGDALDIAVSGAQERLSKAFQTLIDKVHTNLPMLRGHIYKEADINRAIDLDAKLFGDEGSGLTEPEQEVLHYIRSQERNGLKVSVKALIERFGSKPYGWPDVATLCFVAGLSVRGKVEARSDSALLEGSNLVKTLGNSHTRGNVLLTLQEEFTAAQTRKSKDFYKELFEHPANANDARSLGTEWADSIAGLAQELSEIGANKARYPFVAALDPLTEKVAGLKGRPPTFFIAEIMQHEDALLDAKEDTLDPICSFLSGSQCKIYDDARAFLRDHEPNLAYVSRDDATALRTALDDPNCFKGEAIQKIKDAFYGLKPRVEKAVLEERNALGAAIDEVAGKLAQSEDLQALPEAERKMLLDKLEWHRDATGEHIAELRLKAQEVRGGILRDLLLEAANLAKPPPPTEPLVANDGEDTSFSPMRGHEIVEISDLLPRDKLYLQTEEDVTAYTEALRKTLGAEVRAGKKVIV